MRLEYICDVALAYKEGFVLIRPYGGEEGTGYGELEGIVMGDKLQGTLRCVNHPHRRSDGTMLPDTHGLIQTDDRAAIMFKFHGRTFFGEDKKGRQNLAVTFEAEDERYHWLNTSVCVLEGIYDPETKGMRARVYACVNELA